MVLVYGTEQPAPGLFALLKGSVKGGLHMRQQYTCSELKLELFPERKIFLGYGGATALFSSCLVLAYRYQPRLKILYEG